MFKKLVLKIKSWYKENWGDDFPDFETQTYMAYEGYYNNPKNKVLVDWTKEQK